MDDAVRSSVLAVNAGSSSVKFSLYTDTSPPWLLIEDNLDIANPSTVHQEILARVQKRCNLASIKGIGHRIVHGGPDHHQPQHVTDSLLASLETLLEFVPNHLPSELAIIRSFQSAMPDVPQFVCFDTAFHHDLPDVARQLPLPAKLADAGIRRYGFHGLSYTYLLRAYTRLAGESAADGRLIFAHLGSGASLAAVVNRRCIDTSMGFTPTGGLVMGTRSGDLDPGLLAYLLRTGRVAVSDLETFLNKQSGLLGISQQSGDVRDLLQRESTDPRCALALNIFCYQARKWIGAFAAAMGGIDALIFSAGIGEHSPQIRDRICEQLGFLGIEIDPLLNQSNAPVISSGSSRVTVRVIPTNEQIVIAQSVIELLQPPKRGAERVV